MLARDWLSGNRERRAQPQGVAGGPRLRRQSQKCAAALGPTHNHRSIPPARLTVGGVMVPIGSVMLPREVKLGRVTVPGLIARTGVDTSIETTTSWVDAGIGFRASVDMARSVSRTFRGDVGGLSIGNSSNSTWQAMPGVEWRFTEHLYATMAYQAIGFNQGRASNTIFYDANIGVGYRF